MPYNFSMKEVRFHFNEGRDAKFIANKLKIPVSIIETQVRKLEEAQQKNVIKRNFEMLSSFCPFHNKRGFIQTLSQDVYQMIYRCGCEIDSFEWNEIISLRNSLIEDYSGEKRYYYSFFSISRNEAIKRGAKPDSRLIRAIDLILKDFNTN